MTRHFFPNPPRRILVILLAIALYGCGDTRVRALAGTYVTVHDEGGPGAVNIHSRTALTLRDDNHWTKVSELVINGEDMLAGGRIGDAIAPPSHVDSGTFALNGVVLAVSSPGNGVSHYTVSGDTLWRRDARVAALGTAVTGVQAVGGREAFLVRQR